ncbi:hypothetical protein [Oryza sativa Japonica Group]|uniref:Uncharacterized protein n=1 Tax=Oryza sativa subsp. japonica TaxID=39947 RepID=Q5JKU3_ORYSJ|nr:hypothetical protein [Oryza sativa Japonica Group]
MSVTLSSLLLILYSFLTYLCFSSVREAGSGQRARRPRRSRHDAKRRPGQMVARKWGEEAGVTADDADWGREAGGTAGATGGAEGGAERGRGGGRASGQCGLGEKGSQDGGWRGEGEEAGAEGGAERGREAVGMAGAAGKSGSGVASEAGGGRPVRAAALIMLQLFTASVVIMLVDLHERSRWSSGRWRDAERGPGRQG